MRFLPGSRLRSWALGTRVLVRRAAHDATTDVVQLVSEARRACVFFAADGAHPIDVRTICI
jgi:hypothetical protein